jgi:hypothetical protein
MGYRNDLTDLILQIGRTKVHDISTHNFLFSFSTASVCRGRRHTQSRYGDAESIHEGSDIPMGRYDRPMRNRNQLHADILIIPMLCAHRKQRSHRRVFCLFLPRLTPPCIDQVISVS